MTAHIFLLKLFNDDIKVFTNVDSALDKITEAIEDDMLVDNVVSNISLSRLTLKEDEGEYIFMEDLDLEELLGLDADDSDISNIDTDDEDLAECGYGHEQEESESSEEDGASE